VAFEAADPGKEDYGALVSKAVTSGADVFYWGGYEREAGLIVKQLKARGFKGTFVGGDGSKGDNFLKGGGAAANGAILTCPCLDPNASDTAAAKTFVADYKAKFGTPPTIYAAEGHDAALITIEAIRKAGAPSGDMVAYRQKINENVAQTPDLTGLARSYKFEPNGELAGTPGLYLYKVENGKYTLLGLVVDLIK
jgi:branched-chain amino acid transport system substrate-binding protein